MVPCRIGVTSVDMAILAFESNIDPQRVVTERTSKSFKLPYQIFNFFRVKYCHPLSVVVSLA